MNKKNQTLLLLIEEDAKRAYHVQNRLETQSTKITTTKDLNAARKALSSYRFTAILYSSSKVQNEAIQFFTYCNENYPNIPIFIVNASKEAQFGYECAKSAVIHFFTAENGMGLLGDLIDSNDKRFVKSAALNPVSNPLDSIIGESKVMQDLKLEIVKFAQSCSPILILGESGVGKELVAKSIHANSNRSEKPYCISNAAGGNSELVDSRYFGHKKGAFTNAEKDQPGLFQTAENGTLFIDEIGNMPLTTQQKLLRAIEYKEIEPIGATNSVIVDVRILAATHKNLHKAIKNGKFQEDLYHRLSALVIEIPSLNERIEDIPLLAEHISHKICLEEKFELKVLSSQVIQMLMEVDWKGGNIRLLSNFLRSAIVDAGKDADILTTNNFTRVLKDRRKIIG
ncbi:MAG: sigma-54-dependent transcriptional regulator [Saprospiraceae bacterium]